MLVELLYFATAPGAPQSLRLQSVNGTNITIQWDRANCTQRNGLTDSYRVTTIGPDDTDFDIVSGTSEENRMFSLTGLPPRTSYTFEVQAVNTVLFVPGEAATLIVNTSVPQSETSYNKPVMHLLCFNYLLISLQTLVFSSMVGSILTTVLSPCLILVAVVHLSLCSASLQT